VVGWDELGGIYDRWRRYLGILLVVVMVSGERVWMSGVGGMRAGCVRARVEVSHGKSCWAKGRNGERYEEEWFKIGRREADWDGEGREYKRDWDWTVEKCEKTEIT
jgi:hypothetical protein